MCDKMEKLVYMANEIRSLSAVCAKIHWDVNVQTETEFCYDLFNVFDAIHRIAEPLHEQLHELYYNGVFDNLEVGADE